MRTLKLVLAFALVILGASGARAEFSTEDIGKGTFALGLNYPGLGVKYFVSDNYAAEIKAQTEFGDDVGGLRAYRYFRPVPKTLVFLGLEGDYVHFKGASSKGSGYAGEFFVGAEYFVLPHLGLQADFGPAYVHIKDTASSLSDGGVEFVFNLGANYYFGK